MKKWFGLIMVLVIALGAGYWFMYGSGNLGNEETLKGTYIGTTWVAGIIYQVIFFLYFVVLASKVFSSDKVLTMRLGLRKKR